jgi:hypothetical protein
LSFQSSSTGSLFSGLLESPDIRRGNNSWARRALRAIEAQDDIEAFAGPMGRQIAAVADG